MSTSHMTTPHNVLVAYHGNRSSNGRSSDACVHCKKTNHRSDNYFIKCLEKLAASCACRAARGPSLPSGALAVAVISPASWTT
jgi:hypothetical protein